MPTVGADVSFAAESYGYTPEEVAARTEKALSLVKLEGQAETAVYRLSGGQKKLAALPGYLPSRRSFCFSMSPLPLWIRRIGGIF